MGLPPLSVDPSEVGVCVFLSCRAGVGESKVAAQRRLWNVPSALDGLQLRHWSWGSQRRGIQTPSLPAASARILSAGLSFLKGMVPRLGLGRET